MQGDPITSGRCWYSNCNSALCLTIQVCHSDADSRLVSKEWLRRSYHSCTQHARGLSESSLATRGVQGNTCRAVQDEQRLVRSSLQPL